MWFNSCDVSHPRNNTWHDFECHQNSHIVNHKCPYNHYKEFVNQWLAFSCNYRMWLLHGLITLDKLHKTLIIKDNMWHQVTMAVAWRCRVKAWIGGQFGLSHLFFCGLHTNIKFKAILKINIFNLFIVNVVIHFNGNHHKFIGWIIRRLWTCNELLKWQHYVCYMGIIKNVDSEKIKVASKKENKRKSLNEEFISEMHWNFLYI